MIDTVISTHETKTRKAVSIVLSIVYVLKILFLSLPFLFYIFSRNLFLRQRALVILRKTLKSYAVPKTIRKDVIKQMKDIYSYVRLSNISKLR